MTTSRITSQLAYSRTMMDDLCTFYFDHDFKDVDRIIEALNRCQLSFVVKTRSGLSYVPKFKYKTLSIINTAECRHRMAKVMYDLNIPESQIRTKCEEAIMEISTYYNGRITTWLRRKVQEPGIVTVISEFISEKDAWWVPVDFYDSMSEFLDSASKQGLLVTDCIVTRYICEYHLKVCWYFLGTLSAWTSTLEEYLLRNGYQQIPKGRFLLHTLEFGATDFDFSQNPDDFLCDIHVLCLDGQGQLQLRKQQPEPVDHYVAKIKAREMVIVASDLNDSRVVSFIEANDQWNVTNIRYNTQSNKYVFVDEVQKLEQQLDEMRKKLLELESEVEQNRNYLVQKRRKCG